MVYTECSQIGTASGMAMQNACELSRKLSARQYIGSQGKPLPFVLRLAENVVFSHLYFPLFFKQGRIYVVAADCDDIPKSCYLHCQVAAEALENVSTSNKVRLAVHLNQNSQPAESKLRRDSLTEVY